MPLQPGPSTRTTVHVKIEERSQNASNVTSFVELSNGSSADAMSSLQFAYYDTSGPNVNTIALADLLEPKQTVKLDFEQSGINRQVIQFQFRWSFGGIAYGSQTHYSKSGSYFYSISGSIAPDDSDEYYTLIQNAV